MQQPSRHRIAGLAAGAAVALAGTPAAADGPPGGVRFDASVDVPVTLAATAAWVTSELFKSRLAPASCRWCDRAPDGRDTLNALDAGARSALRWSHPEDADTASYATAFALAPAAALGLGSYAAAADNRAHEAPANAVLVLEAAALASDLDQLVKLIAVRQRPFAHFRSRADPAPPRPDDNLSFYSGHTDLAFSLAVSSGTLASVRGYRLAPAVWASSLALAAATGYLRIAADKHYFTDVLTGAVLGSLVGFAVPFLFHRVDQTSAPAGARLGGQLQDAAFAGGPAGATFAGRPPGALGGGGPWLGGAWTF